MKMQWKKNWKRPAVVLAVLVLVGASVYLNWRYAGNVAETDKILGQATLVNENGEGVTVAESQIENLVTAKGYADCVVFMGSDSCSVVVASGEEGLTATDVAKIKDIVINETQYTAGQIKIMEAD